MRKKTVEELCCEYGRFITFEEFRSLKTRIPGRKALDIIDESDADCMILKYDLGYIVELKPSEEYYLIIGRSDWVSPNLDELEAKLFLYLCFEYQHSEWGNTAHMEAAEVRLRYGLPQNIWYL